MVSCDELELQEFIKSICNFEVQTNVRNIISPHELDIYIPDKKLAIEFNGNYWHYTEQKEFDYHQKKTLDCARKHIQLIHIFEYEWNNNKDMIKDFLIDRISNKETIYARDTKVCTLDKEECNEFLSLNHLQGSLNSSIRLGLRDKNNRLVSVMTFGRPRYSSDNEYEVHRLCFIKHNTVIGGAEKLFKYFIDNFNPSSIVTYSDI